MSSLRPRVHPNAGTGSGHSTPPNGLEPDTPITHYPDRLGDERGYPSSPSPGASDHALSGNGVGRAGGSAAVTRLRKLVLSRKGGRFGLSQRAWLALTVIIGFLLLTKLILPTPQAVPQHLDYDELIAHDYINNSAVDTAPFDFCPVFGPGDAVAARRGQFELLRSRLHLGTGARVQRVIQRAMGGLPVTMSVLGGSVSACHGAGDDPVAPECYPARFFNWWNSVFPNPLNELTNGAMKRSDSAYYAYCASQHLPDKTDLVILEFDASDPNDLEFMDYFELLVRSILVRPDQPAVIILGHFSPQVQAQNGFAGPELLHNTVAQFYDVPHISAKGVMYETYLEHPHQALSELYTDSQLANQEGHDLIADVLISYIMSQVCAGWSALLGHSYNVPSLSLQGGSVAGTPLLMGGMGLRPGHSAEQGADDGKTGNDLTSHTGNAALIVPGSRLKDRPGNMNSFREVEPYCVSAGDLVNPLPPSIFHGSGWQPYHPKKGAADDRHFWYAEQPTSRLRVQVRVGAGDIGVYFLQSPIEKPFGVVRCWVDDNQGGAKMLVGNADVEEPIAKLVLIDHFVAKGSHFVECMLEGEEGGPTTPFKILGIFTT